jgi:hypothetical protein
MEAALPDHPDFIGELLEPALGCDSKAEDRETADLAHRLRQWADIRDLEGDAGEKADRTHWLREAAAALDGLSLECARRKDLPNLRSQVYAILQNANHVGLCASETRDAVLALFGVA